MPYDIRLERTDLVYRQTDGLLWLADSEDCRALLGRGHFGPAGVVPDWNALKEASQGYLHVGVWRLAGIVGHPKAGYARVRLYPEDFFGGRPQWLAVPFEVGEAVRALGCSRIEVVP